MSAQDTGGPAFPAHVAADDRGMTLLDYFAGQLAGGEVFRPVLELTPDEELPPFLSTEARAHIRQKWAETVYLWAEALVAEKHRREAVEANP